MSTSCQKNYSLTVTGTSSLVLSFSVNPVNYGDVMNLIGTVTPSSSTGNVSFFNGATLLGTAPLVAGVATFSWNTKGIVRTWSPGRAQITAQWTTKSTFQILMING